jgi:hypothetical protein
MNNKYFISIMCGYIIYFLFCLCEFFKVNYLYNSISKLISDVGTFQYLINEENIINGCYLLMVIAIMITFSFVLKFKFISIRQIAKRESLMYFVIVFLVVYILIVSNMREYGAFISVDHVLYSLFTEFIHYLKYKVALLWFS